MKNLSRTLLLSAILSCTSHEYFENEVFTEGPISNQKKLVSCTQEEKIKGIAYEYESGDLICTRKKIVISENEKLVIGYKTINANSDDPYERGYPILTRYINGKKTEQLKLRRDDDAHWFSTPFVRIREKKFLADLDGDGHLEFAIFPFHPGSAIIGTVRIFSLKKKIEFWGEGRYQFEGDTFVKLGCMRWSKFNLKASKGCY